MKRIFFPLGALIAVFIVFPSATYGAVCGEREQSPAQGPAGKGTVLRGALTLNVDSSQTSVRAGTKERKRRLIFDYTVAGCDISDSSPVADVQLLPHGSNELPEEAVDVGAPQLKPDGLQVVVRVDPKKFDPGKYDLVLRISAPYLVRQNTPAYVSRSDAAVWKPLTAVVIGALVAFGLGLIGVASKATDPLKVRWVWLGVALAATLGAGLWVMFADYWSADVEVWAWPGDWAKTAADAFGAGSAGAIAGILANVIVKKPGHKPKPKPKPSS
jgi:hypothetical protein